MGVCKADIKDIQAILLVINKSNSEAYRKIIPPEYFKEPVLTLDALLKEFEEMTFYACKIEEIMVGVAALRIAEEEVGQIRWVYVLPERQKKGVGVSLINHIENEAKKMKLKKLRVLTSDRAFWAKSFYSKLGYKMIDKIPRPWGDDAVYEKTLT